MRSRILSLILLTAVTIIFIGISSRFLIHPVTAAAAQGMALRNGFAITTVRIGLGVFPLGLALVTATGIALPKFRVPGLRFLTVLFGIALAVRIFSVFADHAASGNMRLVVIEAIVMVACVIALLIEKSAARETRPA